MLFFIGLSDGTCNPNGSAISCHSLSLAVSIWLAELMEK